MTEVVIKLALSRRSGILAAAVSALTRAGLTFRSHHLEPVKHDGRYRLDLLADTDESLGDPRAIIDALVAIRGVETIVDCVIEGRSLLGPDKPTADDEAEVHGAGDPPANDDGSAGPAHGATDRASQPEPKPEPEPAPEIAAEAAAGKPAQGRSADDRIPAGTETDSGNRTRPAENPRVSDDAAASPRDERRTGQTPEDARQSGPGSDDSNSQRARPMRSSMVRRRRRRR